MATKLKITQTRSRIGQKPRHRATLDTLGLRKINDITIRERTDVLEGQLRLVNHLVRIEEAKEA
ncbi:MAG: ribosomal protein [Thermoleophilia bacterium]|nr:ribosomal protein [Thermoleophilia bacterium]